MTTVPWLYERDGALILEVLVQPRASRSRIVGEHDGRLKIQLAAPPVDGEANNALVTLLAELLSVGRTSITIEQGQTGRRKRVRVVGRTLAAARTAFTQS